MSLARIIALHVGIFCYFSPGLALGDQQVFDQLSAPKYVPLEQGEEWLEGVVRDENTTTELEGISFFGNCSVGGACREDNDSVTTVHLAAIRKIEMKKQEYQSPRYPNKKFCVVDKVHIDGTVTHNLLMPYKLVVCGIEKKTKDEKCWFLGKIDQLEIKPIEFTSSRHSGQHFAHKVHAIEHPEQHQQHAHRAAPLVIQQPSHDSAKHVVVLEKQTGAMESKTVTQSVLDLLVAIIGVFKAVFEGLRSLLF